MKSTIIVIAIAFIAVIIIVVTVTLVYRLIPITSSIDNMTKSGISISIPFLSASLPLLTSLHISEKMGIPLPPRRAISTPLSRS